MVSQKAAKNVASIKSNIPSYRPPTANGISGSVHSSMAVIPQIKSKKSLKQAKKPSLASISESNNFVSITSVNTSNQANQNEKVGVGLERAQHQYLIEQINNFKLMIKQKDKKVEKHKDFINKLKGSLESVLLEHKKQAEQIENQKRELRVLKCKMSIH